MEYEWDEAKSVANWATAQVVADERADHGEVRWLALGLLGGHLYSLAFTICGRRIRVISLRTASRKERTLYEQAERR